MFVSKEGEDQNLATSWFLCCEYRQYDVKAEQVKVKRRVIEHESDARERETQPERAAAR